MIVFSNFKTMLSIIEDYCDMKDIPYCRLDGNTELEEREEQIEDFTQPGSDKVMFLISTRAGGLGINLYTANHVVLFDSDFNPQIDLQAMDRAHRIGQRKKVFVYRLVCRDTIEEKIVQRQAIKLKMDQVFIQHGRKVTQSAPMSKLEYEQVLLHGAAKIMAQKTGLVAFDSTSLDIEALIEEGIEKNRAIAMEADQQANQAARSLSNGYDMSMESINTFQFQD